MVISKLNLDKIEKNITLIQEFLLELRNLSKLSKEEFLSDSRNPASAESFLRRSLECIFDIGRHIMAKTFGFKDFEYKSIARELGNKGIISKEYSEILIKMAGYRNRMVHFYHEVTKEELFDLVNNYLDDIDKFTKEIAFFISNYKKSSQN